MSFKHDFNRFDSMFPLRKKRVNDLSFTYRMGGKGPGTLILLVGGLGFSDMFYNHIIRFSENYQVITFDYPLETCRNSELARGISQLIAELGLEKVILAGQSFGGLLAQVIAREHPEQVEAMILSNTGCLSKDLCREGREEFAKIVKSLKKTRLITRLVPLPFLKEKFIEGLQKHLDHCDSRDRPYYKELFQYIVGKINKTYERHMCSLMIDLVNHGHMKKEDFSYLEGKVLLLLSEDDDTFSEAMKKDLIGIMPRPVVNKEIRGGHVALLFHREKYVEAVEAFLAGVMAGRLET